MRIFVTGASGFIGGAIARQLAQRHDVTAMSRSAASDAAIAALGATPLRCELDTLMPGQLPSCDAVVHGAAYVESWGSREDFVRGNVDGTDRVLAAARAAGARSVSAASLPSRATPPRCCAATARCATTKPAQTSATRRSSA